MGEFFEKFVTRDTSGAAKPPKITKDDLRLRFEKWYKEHYGINVLRFEKWYKEHHGINVPLGKELYDFMDARCGHHVKGAWSGYYLNVNADVADVDSDSDDDVVLVKVVQGHGTVHN